MPRYNRRIIQAYNRTQTLHPSVQPSFLSRLFTLDNYNPWSPSPFRFNLGFNWVHVSGGLNSSGKDNDKPSTLTAILAFMLIVAAAVASLIYSAVKVKKALENILVNRKWGASLLRLFSAGVFGYFGWVWGSGLGVYYAPALLGMLSVPVFGVAGVLVMAGVGIAFTKYLLKFARWMMGYVSNTGADSLSRTAAANYSAMATFINETPGQKQTVNVSEQGIKAQGILRAYLYDLKKAFNDSNVDEYLAAIGKGLYSPQIDAAVRKLYEDQIDEVKKLSPAENQRQPEDFDIPGYAQACAHLARTDEVIFNLYGRSVLHDANDTTLSDAQKRSVHNSKNIQFG